MKLDFTQSPGNYVSDSPEYKMLVGRADEVRKTLRKAFDEHELSVHIEQDGPYLELNFADAGEGQRFLAALGDRGIRVPDKPFVSSLDHTWDDLERAGDAFAAAASVV